jgi:hypothetical protein
VQLGSLRAYVPRIQFWLDTLACHVWNLSVTLLLWHRLALPYAPCVHVGRVLYTVINHPSSISPQSVMEEPTAKIPRTIVLPGVQNASAAPEAQIRLTTQYVHASVNWRA